MCHACKHACCAVTPHPHPSPLTHPNFTPTPTSAGQEAVSAAEVRQLVQQHIASLPLNRWDHISAFEVLAEPFR